MVSLSSSEQQQRINIIRIGSIASLLFAASLAAVAVSEGSLTSVSTIPDQATAVTFLNDVAPHRNLLEFAIWILGFTAFLLVPFAIGLYEGLHQWDETLMRVARLAFIITAVFVAITAAVEAPVVGYIGPAWAGTTDAAMQARLASTTAVLSWTDNALYSISNLTVGIGVLASGIAMIRVSTKWWRVLGWIGVVGGIATLLATFVLLSPVFEVIDFVGTIAVFIWLLGTCAGLWQLTMAPSTSEASISGTAAVNPGGSSS